MANTVEMNQQEIAIQGLIGQYLAARPGTTPQSDHLDQDTLAAFVEGSLTRRSGENAVGHLVECSHCRHISAELIRLDIEFAESAPAAASTDNAPGKISEVLSGLFSKIFGPVDGAVFAHNEDEKDKEKESDHPDKNKKGE
jgi:hypothetical protein